MKFGRWYVSAFASLVLYVPIASAQSTDERESVAIAELGAAPSWSVPGFGSSLSPTVAVEFTPIEHWLEIEIGTTPTFSRHSTEWGTDFLFKKPWTLSKKVEFMAGVGPEWIHTRNYGVSANSIGGEVALDFMFWPNPKGRLGWYLEPAYDYDFGRGHQQAVGISGGILIKLP